jgi:DNA polymerase-1
MACAIISADHKVQVSYELGIAVLKGKPCENPYPWLTKGLMKSSRQMAKAANFGFPGGLGAKRFVDYARDSYGVVLTEEQARRLQQNWRKTFPENNVYRQYIESLSRGDSFAITHASGMIRSDCLYTDASNNLFQGRAALMSTRALIVAVNECLTPGTVLSGCKPYAFVHDEILIAAPLSRASAVAKRLREIMRAAGKEICPDVRSDAPPAFAFRWYKAMEEVWDGDTLLPWVPNVTDGKGNWNKLSPGEQPDKGWHWEDPWEVRKGFTKSTIPEGVRT